MRINSSDSCKESSLKSRSAAVIFLESRSPSIDLTGVSSLKVPQRAISLATKSSVRSIGRRTNFIPRDWGKGLYYVEGNTFQSTFRSGRSHTRHCLELPTHKNHCRLGHASPLIEENHILTALSTTFNFRQTCDLIICTGLYTSR